MGNAIVVKPAIAGTRTAVRLAGLFRDAGWPEGLFNIVTGDRGPALALVAHRDVRAVPFTRGTTAGKELVRAAGARQLLPEIGPDSATIEIAHDDPAFSSSRIAAPTFSAHL